MQDTSVLFLGNRRDLASVASLLVEHFADVACDFRSNLVEARELLKRSGVRLILFYWNSEDARDDFDALVKELQLRHHKPAVIVITDADRPAVVLHVLRHGAVDCLCRPVNPNRLKFLVGNLIGHSGGGTHTPQAERGTRQDTPVTFQSDCMRALVDSLRLAARSDSTILLTGETGTGKNHLAAFTHYFSPRRHQPLVTVDCGASSENLIESDLFGHVRGAFTGADREHIGKLERVGSGTVLLDEINSLPMPCQTRLLRVLEERVFEKLGGERTQKFFGRVIALTNKPLEIEVAERRFRQDLFYRLNVITFVVPPLRDRREDVLPTVELFLERLVKHHGSHVTRVSRAAMAALTAHSWPGNLRELRNVLERAIALSDSAVLEPRHLNLPVTTDPHPDRSAGPRTGSRLTQVRHEAERRELQSVLERLENNRTRAAKHLGISRSALYKRLEKLDLL